MKGRRACVKQVSASSCPIRLAPVEKAVESVSHSLEKAIGAEGYREAIEGNGMKCPDCGGTIKLQKSDISCSLCGWKPSPTVLSMYRLAPLTNRRILLGTLSMLISAGGYFLLFDLILPALILCICGLALVPITFAVRSYAVKRMIGECEGI